MNSSGLDVVKVGVSALYLPSVVVRLLDCIFITVWVGFPYPSLSETNLNINVMCPLQVLVDSNLHSSEKMFPASEINQCKQQRELKLPHVGVKLKERK